MRTKRNAAWQETDFERWFDVNPYLPDGERVLLIGRQRAMRRMVDLIALDRDGGLVILAVTSGRFTWRAAGQALESLANHEDLSTDALLGDDKSAYEVFRDAFRATFGTEPPLLTPRRRVFLVAPSHDAFTATCARYLSRHLSKAEITIELLRAAKSLGGFALRGVEPPQLKRASVLDRVFAASTRNRVYYVLEPGAAPVVWSIGRLRDGDASIALRAKPGRRALRMLKGNLLPLQHPEQIDLTNSGTVWMQRGRENRLAKVIGTVRDGGGKSQVVFAAFQGEGFKSFRSRPIEEFFTQWAPSEASLPDWRAIARLAQDQVDARKTRLNSP